MLYTALKVYKYFIKETRTRRTPTKTTTFQLLDRDARGEKQSSVYDISQNESWSVK